MKLEETFLHKLGYEIWTVIMLSLRFLGFCYILGDIEQGLFLILKIGIAIPNHSKYKVFVCYL